MQIESKVLSIDGGGIRGIIPCKILAYIEKKTNFPVSNLFNLVAGTSTGGIIAMGLTVPKPKNSVPYTVADMLHLYESYGSVIFSKRDQDFWSWVSAKVFNKPYDSSKIESLLTKYFADRTLGESVISTLVTTYEIEKGLPFYFSSRLAKMKKDENFAIREIARSTSAAPTYFKPSIIKNEGADYFFIDGGVFANNPAILAYNEGKEILKEERLSTTATHDLIGDKKGFMPRVQPDDEDIPMFLLSIGCGYFSTQIQFAEIENWRNWNWCEPLLKDTFMRSVSESTHFTMQHLLPPYKNGFPRYIRLDPKIEGEVIEMDDASKTTISRLNDIADDYIETEHVLIDEVCKLIMK